MSLKNKTIKGMDSALWHRVHMAVIRRRFAGNEGMTIAKWLSEAIRVKLRKEKG